MAEEFRRLWEALTRHQRTRPASYRMPYWYKKVDILRRIDEVIEIADENDRYGEPKIFDETDADGRWMLHVAEHHERCREITTARSPVCHLGVQTAGSQQQPQSENLALGNPHNAGAAADTDAGVNRTLGFVHSQSRETVQPEGSHSSSESGAHLSGPRVRTESSTNRRTPVSRDTPNGHSNVADRNKENQKRTQSSIDPNGSSTSESDSSDDEDMSTDADDAEQERILQLFEDFPTCIQKARHLPAVDNDDHGIMIISNPESGWSHLDSARLPPRVRKYLAEFTVLKAAAFPDGVYPDLALNGAGSRRWLLATARKEFICDTSTLDELAADSAQRKRRLIQNSRNFQDRHGPRGSFRAGPPRRRAARGPRALPRCNWQFWDEPDDTNRGPQIIVTEPSGDSHYLVDLDTFRLKVRQRRECRSGQVTSYVEKSRMADRMEAMASFSAEEMEKYGDDEDSALPSYTSGHSTRWWLRWGRMFLRPGSQPRTLLPMYHNDLPSDPEKAGLLGYDGAQDEKSHKERVGTVRSPGIVGALRDLACCCSKS